MFQPVLRTYDVFSTKWTNIGRSDYWTAHFLKCKHCGKRKFETNYPYSSKPHVGLEKTKNNWLDRGYISDSVKNPQKYQKPQDTTPDSGFKINGLTVDTKTAKIVMKALSTKSESEAVACLKMARRAYQNAEG